MRPTFERAPAKINLTLDALRRRDDGYHDLQMVMQTVSLADMISLRGHCGEGIHVRTNLGYLPCDARNTAYLAARAFFDSTGIPCDGVQIMIEKRIPVAAGLAGGSADAAAVLRALNRLYETKLTDDALCAIGLTVGADVPYCVRGGTQLAEGVGEVLSPLPPMPPCQIVLCKPAFGMSTARVFGALDCTAIPRHPDLSAMRRALKAGDVSAIGAALCNVLEPIAAAERGEILKIKDLLCQYGAVGACMSGSGSTVFGIFSDPSRAKTAQHHLRRRHRDTFLTEPVKGSEKENHETENL